MTRLLALLIPVLLCAACDSMPGKPQDSARPLRPSEVTDFATLYGANCAGCHGEDGRLGPALPLAHPLYLAFADDAALTHAVSSGVTATSMPPFAQSAGGTLTDSQIKLLIDGMRQRWAKPDPLTTGETLPPYASTGNGDAARGSAVFDSACARCHGAEGNGAEVRGSIVDPSYLALVSDQGLRTLVVVGRPDLKHPDWRGYGGAPLSDQQVADVVGWLAAKRAPFPGQPYARAQ